MKRIYELEVYKLSEELSDLVWYDFDKWNKKVQNSNWKTWSKVECVYQQHKN